MIPSHSAGRRFRDAMGESRRVAHRTPSINRRYVWGPSCEPQENCDKLCEPDSRARCPERCGVGAPQNEGAAAAAQAQEKT